MKKALWLLPCWVSPIALTATWTIAGGMGAFGYADYSYFLSWLTKYPNFGPVNRDVLLGMICVIGLAVLPVLFAAIAMFQRSERRWPLWTLCVSQLVLFVPVLLVLDLNLWFAGTVGIAYFDAYRPALIGPVLHLTSLISMIVVAARHRRWRARPIELTPASL